MTPRSIIELISFLLCVLIVNACEKEDVNSRPEHSLPIVEIDIAEKYLWSPDSGLYILGSNGIHTDCSEALVANYNQKWEFPATVRYFEASKDFSTFEYEVGFRIKGNCSRRKAMKSIGLYWRKEYGKSSFTFPLFPDSDNQVYKRLLLRNSGNDFGLTHIKDAAIIKIIKDYANVDYQEYSPVILYLNEEYWGIHNLREQITPHHFKYHYGVDDDLVDILDGSILSPTVDDGSRDAFLKEVVEFVENNDLAIAENYQTISKRVDIDNIIDYFIIETYIGNKDWPGTNTKWWRENSDNEAFNKWRWINFDQDASFRSANVDFIWIGDLYGESSSPTKAEGFYLFNHLLRNEDFRKQFLMRYRFFIDVVFDPDRVAQIITRMKQNIESEYPRHQKKWNTLPMRQWKMEIDEFIKVNRKRNELMRGIIDTLDEEN